jgi:hypothetical protein
MKARSIATRQFDLGSVGAVAVLSAVIHEMADEIEKELGSGWILEAFHQTPLPAPLVGSLLLTMIGRRKE